MFKDVRAEQQTRREPPKVASGGSSPVQSSPVQSSPVQSSPVQSSPVQSSPVQSSPVQQSGRSSLLRQSRRLNLNNNSGIISVVALGMFALMIYFSLLVMENTIRAYDDIRNSMNYTQAQISADSGSEFLLWTLKKHEAGYNFTKECNYPAGETYTPEGGGSVCDDFFDHAPGKDFKISVSIKARAELDENLRTEKCRVGLSDINDKCYVVPFPKTGSAGEMCKLYTPVFGATGDGYYISSGPPVNLSNGIANVDQLDYSCNWNKLKFGSSVIDRVSIPLYYESGLDADGNSIIVNPFFNNGFPAEANVIGLRIRTPCKCGTPGADGRVPVGDLDCTGNNDRTVCTDRQRYVLNDGDGDDIVVQWQINGMCGGEECGLIGFPEDVSAIYESIINDKIFDATYILLKNDTIGIQTDVDSYSENRIELMKKLTDMEKPVLSLFLSNALIDENGDNIPYLEYQLITNHPVANPTNRLESTARVDGNNGYKLLLKDEPKDLIDFAVQN